GRLSLFQYPQGINLHKIFYTPATDLLAIEKDNADHLLDKGAYYYGEGQYAEAVEYYRLAAAMGSTQAIANLGYCYLYGRELEANLS
ncbi:hypothetical protein VPJ60_09160, partial [Limosilactobacillus fermentum]